MIADSTKIQAYQLRKGGTPARMAILRMIAAASQRPEIPPSLNITDWRGARRYGLHTYAAAYGCFAQGMQGKTPIWYTHTGPAFRDERFADECEGGPDHRGWFTQADGITYEDGTGLARGIVGRLTHGRFVAGYYWGDNGERVYFPEVFNDERNAARMADEHARVFAESAQEDNARFEAMQDAETALQDAIETLRDTWALRRQGRRDSNDVNEAIETLRDAREALQTATVEYERA